MVKYSSNMDGVLQTINVKVNKMKDSKRLLALNRSVNNRFIEIDGGTHHNIRNTKLYLEKLQEILNVPIF